MLAFVFYGMCDILTWYSPQDKAAKKAKAVEEKKQRKENRKAAEIKLAVKRQAMSKAKVCTTRILTGEWD